MEELMNNSLLVTGMLGWIVAQLIKAVLVLITEKRFDFTRLTGSGGMPSSHSSLVCSITTAVGLTHGFNSDLFTVCLIFSLVVMYDAAGVRRAAGKQAEVLNKMMREWDEDGTFTSDKSLKELIGHTPFQVICGALLGICIGVLRVL